MALALTTQSSGSGRTVAAGLPGVLVLMLLGVWQVQAHRRLAVPRPSRSLVLGVAALLAAAVAFGRLAAVGEYGRLQTFLPVIALAYLAGARGHARTPSYRELAGLVLDPYS